MDWNFIQVNKPFFKIISTKFLFVAQNQNDYKIFYILWDGNVHVHF